MAGEPVQGAIGVVCRQDRYLVIRRAAGVAAEGMWCFPGGALKDAETFEQAVEREMREEVGLTVRAKRELWRWESKDGELALRWWLVAEDKQNPVRPDAAEVAEASWLPLEKISALEPLIEGNREFLAEVFAERIRLD